MADEAPLPKPPPHWHRIAFIAGITGGLAVPMAVSLALWPSVYERHGHA